MLLSCDKQGFFTITRRKNLVAVGGKAPSADIHNRRVIIRDKDLW